MKETLTLMLYVAALKVLDLIEIIKDDSDEQ